MSEPTQGLPAVSLNPAFVGYRCVICNLEQAIDYQDNVCPSCGVDGILDVLYDNEQIRAQLSGESAFAKSRAGGLWRYAAVMPVQPSAPHSAWTLGESPLHFAPRAGQYFGQNQLWIKDDTALPSASLKDRAAAVAIAHAQHLGRTELACASTGNAAASLAVLGARAGFTSNIFVPAAAPAAKLAQLLLHGATVVRVDGTYDQAFDLSLAKIAEHGWYSRNCAHNPLLVEGKKTVAYEMAYSLTAGFTAPPKSWPDVVLVPVGDGCIVSSVAKGFLEMHNLGLTPSVPRIIGVQAEGAAPLAQAWAEQGSKHADLSGPDILAAVKPVECSTIADSISVGIPRNRIKAWQKVAATGGGFLAVSDEMITDAIAMMASRAGVFAEPSGAAGLAGLLAARDKGWLQEDECVAVLVTGHGLKDPSAALDLVTVPNPEPPLSSS
ncbi:MAG: threonine synthase [Candidatus Krumholzibacteriia bacterium]|jgi:threonine synthase